MKRLFPKKGEKIYKKIKHIFFICTKKAMTTKLQNLQWYYYFLLCRLVFDFLFANLCFRCDFVFFTKILLGAFFSLVLCYFCVFIWWFYFLQFFSSEIKKGIFLRVLLPPKHLHEFLLVFLRWAFSRYFLYTTLFFIFLCVVFSENCIYFYLHKFIENL